jgi:flagellar basal body-associated protein FliL
LSLCGHLLRQVDNNGKGGRKSMGILWIILIVILVLALLGFFSRGYW